jgi:preprotein translocase subunit SecF
MWFGFSVKDYHAKLAKKAQREAEKERIRAQYESGVM